MKFFRSLSHSVVSLSKSFLINKTRLPNARGRRQHKENLSRSRGTLFRFRFCSRNARRECVSTRENFRALFNDDLLFFLGQKQPVWVEKDSRNSLRAFAFKSQKRSIMCENEWCDLFLSLSLSLSGKRAERGGTLVKTLASKRRKALLWGRVYVARRRKL